MLPCAHIHKFHVVIIIVGSMSSGWSQKHLLTNLMIIGGVSIDENCGIFMEFYSFKKHGQWESIYTQSSPKKSSLEARHRVIKCFHIVSTHGFLLLQIV